MTALEEERELRKQALAVNQEVLVANLMLNVANQELRGQVV